MNGNVVIVKANTKESPPQTPAILKKWMSGEELLKLNIKEVPKLWDPFLVNVGLVGISGPSESGKSTLMRELAIAIANKKKSFLGYKLNARHNRAYAVLTEDGRLQTSANLNKSYAQDAENNLLANIFFLFDVEMLVKDLDEKLTSAPADLVIIDAWSDTFTGNINSLVDVRQDLNQLSKLAEKHECTIAIIHHNGKNSEKQTPDKNKLNGSQAIEAKLRCLLELRKGDSDNERVLSIVKSNYLSEKVKGISIILNHDPERHVFLNSGKTLDKSSLNEKIKISEYSVDLWVPRMLSYRNKFGTSYKDSVTALKKFYPNDSVPGETWFKEHCKESIVQSSVTEAKGESDLSTEKNEKNGN